jgi:hypothetical protein
MINPGYQIRGLPVCIVYENSQILTEKTYQ